MTAALENLEKSRCQSVWICPERRFFFSQETKGEGSFVLSKAGEGWDTQTIWAGNLERSGSLTKLEVFPGLEPALKCQKCPGTPGILVFPAISGVENPWGEKEPRHWFHKGKTNKQIPKRGWEGEPDFYFNFRKNIMLHIFSPPAGSLAQGSTKARWLSPCPPHPPPRSGYGTNFYPLLVMPLEVFRQT